MSPNVRSSRKKTPPLSNLSEEPAVEMDAKLKLMDDELLAFHEYCKTAGFTEDEMRQICAPLLTTFRRVQLIRLLKIFGIVIILLAIIITLGQVSSVALHLTAVGRILLMQLLPIWDWSKMFYESCIIKNPYYKEYTFNEQDCVSCESLENIDRLTMTSYQHILDGYLQRDAPVIIQDAMDTWTVMNTDDFWFDNITELYLNDEKLRDTVPCVMSSNIRTSSSDLLPFLSKIHNPKLDKWFVHWQNCDLNAVKALRKFYQRPYFLANTVSAAHFNWVLMSSDYHAKLYKKIELDTGLIQLAQLRGSTIFRISPHETCNSTCSELHGELHEGEMLVFTSYMWNFEYLPPRASENIAILTETVWDELTIY